MGRRGDSRRNLGRIAALSLAAFVAASGCSSDAGDPVPAAPAASGAPADGDARRARRPFRPSRVDLDLVQIVDGLDSPLGLANAADGSGLLYVVEQGGLIKIIDGRRVLDEPFLDLTALTMGGGERGLLGLAFHPRYEENGRFFVNYTDLGGDTVVAEYRRSAADERRGDPASGRTVLQIDQPFSNHNGGHLAFGPDGYLYIGMGDGGSAGDPLGNGQNLDTLLGKMLRIDIDESSATRAYGIPPDNPYADGDGGRPEIWASGLRNPWRYSFDRATGRLWIADVGQGELEEVNRASGTAAPLNYGWNVMEGDRCYESSSCDRDGLKLPLAVYSHDQGCSVTGGYVYRGTKFPRMKGGYFFSDYCSGIIWAVPSGAQRPRDPAELLVSDRSVSSFGENERGELFVTDIASGSVLKLIDKSA